MSFNAIRENKILAKISESAVVINMGYLFNVHQLRSKADDICRERQEFQFRKI